MDSDSDERSTQQGNMRNIVDLVKSGRINRSDAFTELKSYLKKGKENASLDDTNLSPPTATESVDLTAFQEDTTNSMQKLEQTSTSGFSKEDRRLLINKLIEKKRQSKMQQMQNPSDSFRNPNNEYEYIDESGPQEYRGREYDNMTSPNNQRGRARSAERPGSAVSDSRRGVNRQRAKSAERPRSASGTGEVREYVIQSFDAGRSAHDVHPFDLRSNKLAIAEAATREEMFRECTFKPKVKPLPSTYGPLKEKDSEFTERVMKWQKEKEVEASRRKTLREQNVVQDCTFKPRINRNSEKAVKLNRGHEQMLKKETTGDRLYKTHFSLNEQKIKIIDEEKRRVAEEMSMECPFKPSLSTKKSSFRDVEPKYRHVDYKKTIPEPTQGEMAKDCTFTPKVKGIRKSMSSAKLYVSTNVVDRLTRPINIVPPSPDEMNKHFDNSFGDRPVMDVASFMGSLAGGGSRSNTPGGTVTTSRSRPNSAPRERRTSDQQSKAEPLTEEERMQRQQNFKAFLGRQAQLTLRREKKTEHLQSAMTPNFKTEINSRSEKLARRHSKGSFLDRVQKDVLRREDKEQEILKRPVEESFQPSVTSRASKLRGRAPYELSRGDLHKKETNDKLLRLKFEQEELMNLTFQPSITPHAAKSRSVLQLIDNPGAFLERHATDKQKAERKYHETMEARAKQELDSCTFKPQTIDCPAYIKRIARSLAVVKASKMGDDNNENMKQQWK